MANPAATGIALLSIALSVGATGVVFAAIKSVLINPLPFAHPEQLVQVRAEFANSDRSRADWAFWGDAQEIIHRTRTLESLGIYVNAIFDLAGDPSTPPEALYGLRVSADLFPTLGVKPMLGRNISPEEDRPGDASEMILSYGLWKRRFNADPGIVGRSVFIDGHDCLVIGVMPPEFNFPLRRAAAHTPSPYVEFWAPLQDRPRGSTVGLGVVARLRHGVALSEAQQDLATISADLSREFPATNRDHVLRLGFLRDRTLGSARTALWFLMAATVMFLLIGCANVANLLLARGFARQKEIAIRIAIGAGSTRIIRQFLTESCVLAVLGGVGGYAITFVAWKVLPAIAPVSIPRLAAARADGRVFVFSLAVALINGVLFGMAPALRAGFTGMIATQDFGARGGAGRRDRVRGSLVAVEVAITLILVVIGGRLMGSFIDLIRSDPGFQADHVIASVVPPSPERYPTPRQRGALYSRFLDSVRAIPGVESAGTVDALPFSGENHGGLISATEAGVLEPNLQVPAEIDVVSADYLQTMGVRLVEGRWFRQDEMSAANDAAIVNDITAARLWPGVSALGKRICLYCTPEKPNNWKQVVAVVADVRHATMEGPQQASVYLSSSALESAQFLVVRTNRPAAGLDKAIRAAIAAVDPSQPVFLSASMQSLIADSLADRRFIMSLLAITGCLALAMSLAGVYGVTSYITSRRTQEIGIRMALGATRANVQVLIFRQGFFAAAIGLIFGLLSTFALLRILRGILPGLASGQVAPVGLAVSLVSLTAALACWLPARRAASVDPMLALRQE